MSYHSGFVALIGKPNVGKSTLLNTILSKKVAIATPKPQTTRDNIRGILTLEDCQIVFIDTPGIHKASIRLNELMVKSAYEAAGDVDIILMLVSAEKGIDKGDRIIMESIRNYKKPKFLVVNKIDKLNKSELIEFMQGIENDIFDEIIPLSALKNDNVSELIETIKKYLPEDLQYYPSDMISDYPESFMISEIIREKIMMFTNQEIPHSVAVYLEQMEERKNVVYINATIVTEKDSQKAIIIGKNGQMLKRIASFAREELQERLGKKVFLEVFVKVEEDWRNKRSQLMQLGYLDSERNE
ncbi:MAG: GTPase Era, partial [Erysipelotrichaceae bacterium]|nr:GTPase Era [Erysipelotrichaceae bacterium]